MADPAHIAAHAARQENVCARRLWPLVPGLPAGIIEGGVASFGDLPSAKREPCGDEGGDDGVLVGDNYGHKEEDAYPKAKEEAAEV
jgi:hypothetical protein